LTSSEKPPETYYQTDSTGVLLPSRTRLERPASAPLYPCRAPAAVSCVFVHDAMRHAHRAARRTAAVAAACERCDRSIDRRIVDRSRREHLFSSSACCCSLLNGVCTPISRSSAHVGPKVRNVAPVLKRFSHRGSWRFQVCSCGSICACVCACVCLCLDVGQVPEASAPFGRSASRDCARAR